MEKILIVDDEALFRRVLRMALVVKGYEIREAATGAEAISLMQDESPDLVLVDWMMPGMDGIKLCRAIRTESDVPIILITSKRGGESEARAAGANAYVTKPFPVDELLTQIEFTLSR